MNGWVWFAVWWTTVGYVVGSFVGWVAAKVHSRNEGTTGGDLYERVRLFVDDADDGCEYSYIGSHLGSCWELVRLEVPE